LRKGRYQNQIKIPPPPLHSRVADPDPHYFWKLDPDPHVSEKLDFGSIFMITENSKILVVKKYNLKAFMKAFQPTGEASRLPQDDIQHIKKKNSLFFLGGGGHFCLPVPDSHFGSTSPVESGVRTRNTYFNFTVPGTFHALKLNILRLR
jgi:hypothetical protein